MTKSQLIYPVVKNCFTLKSLKIIVGPSVRGPLALSFVLLYESIINKRIYDEVLLNLYRVCRNLHGGKFYPLTEKGDKVRTKIECKLQY